MTQKMISHECRQHSSVTRIIEQMGFCEWNNLVAFGKTSIRLDTRNPCEPLFSLLSWRVWWQHMNTHTTEPQRRGHKEKKNIWTVMSRVDNWQFCRSWAPVVALFCAWVTIGSDWSGSMVGLYTKYYCVATLFYIVIFELIFCKIPKYRINSASVLYL